MKSEDEIKRAKIPSRSDLPTHYHPCGSILMVIPLPDIYQVGNITLPDRARITLTEGHIVETGPINKGEFEVGDCITWADQSEWRMEVDGIKFVLVEPANVIMKIPKAELLAQIEKEKLALPNIKLK